MKKILSSLILIMFAALNLHANGYNVGDNIQDFKLKNVNGKSVSLADYPKAKGFIIVFTCNTCPYAIKYDSRVQDLATKYNALDYPVIAINPNDPIAQPEDTEAKMKAKSKKLNFAYPYLMDPDHLVTKAFGATNTPHTFVIQKTNAGNKVVYIGAIDNDTENTKSDKIKYVEDAITALMNNQTIAITKTKAIGCTVKWKK